MQFSGKLVCKVLKRLRMKERQDAGLWAMEALGLSCEMRLYPFGFTEALVWAQYLCS